MSDLEKVLRVMRSRSTRANIQGMERFGITPRKALGVSAPVLHRLAKNYRGDHELALKLWKTGIHDARILAALIDEPKKVTKQQMERWVRQFDTWAVCDTTVGRLLSKTPGAFETAVRWSRSKREFIKRAGYAMMAYLTLRQKEADDAKFLRLFPHLIRGAVDGRNYVKKAVNWAIRQIGKKNARLNQAAIRLSKKLHALDVPSAKWIASDALRELTSKTVQKRIR
jgi:3-methyladenine DNA glycosylase AlkD